MDSLWSLMCSIILSKNKYALSSFPICISSHHNGVAKTLSTLLDSSGDSGQPNFFPDFNGITLSISPLR